MSNNTHEETAKAEEERLKRLDKALSIAAEINKCNEILAESRQNMTHFEKNKLKSFLKEIGYTREHLKEDEKKVLDEEEIEIYNSTLNNKMTPMPKGYTAFNLSFESKKADERIKEATQWIVDGIDGKHPNRDVSDDSMKRLEEGLAEVKKQMDDVMERYAYYQNDDPNKEHLKGSIDFDALRATLEADGLEGVEKALQKNSYLVDCRTINVDKEGEVRIENATATYISGVKGEYGSLETPFIKGGGAFVPLNDVPVTSANQVVINAGNLENQVITDENSDKASKVKNNSSPQDALANTLFASKRSLESDDTSVVLVDVGALQALQKTLSNAPNMLVITKATADNNKVIIKDENGVERVAPSVVEQGLDHLGVRLVQATENGKNAILTLPEDFDFKKLRKMSFELTGNLEEAKSLTKEVRDTTIQEAANTAQKFADYALGKASMREYDNHVAANAESKLGGSKKAKNDEKKESSATNDNTTYSLGIR